jgi:tetratricopeptide (TPR) repeat protein
MGPNSPEAWDQIWSDPAQAEWRAKALADVYDRIEALVPEGVPVIDLGGGVGTLARRLVGVVWDHSPEAVRQAPVGSRVVDLEAQITEGPDAFYVATETLEHLTDLARAQWLHIAARGRGLLASIPNNRLGPEVEPQHHIQWTAIEFLRELRRYFDHARVEVLGPYLLGVAGPLAKKPFRLSVCTPARDEAADIERTLASFRGVADQLVVGIDPRSTDDTQRIAEQYADRVFTLTDPDGPPDDKAPAVHFAHIRNQCLDKCDGDWIFMTEAHESLKAGQDALLNLDQLGKGAKIAFVMRTGNGQRWAFPWLHRNDSRIRYQRATHNVLDFPAKWLCVRLPQIETLHERAADTIEQRRAQRKVQNRRSLTEDWIVNGNANSLLYLGAEWSEHDPDKAIERLQEFLTVNRSNGSQRYHVRLQCAKLLARVGKMDEARAVLVNAVADDWSRVDHWFFLGDIALEAGRHDEALQFYRYVSTRIGDIPFCPWWITVGIYGYLCAQRLTECYAALGKLDDALHWAQRAVDLMPDDSPDTALDEAKTNVERITEAIDNASQASPN